MRLREIYDPARIDKGLKATLFKTEQNQFKWRCETCGNILFVDKIMFESLNKALERCLGNQLKCEKCREEYDKFSFESRVALL